VNKLNTVATRRSVVSAILLAILVVGAGYLAATEKKAEQGYLGVSINSLSHQDKKDLGIGHGVLVTDVVKEGPAEKAGIKKGDVIQFVNGEKMTEPEEVTQIIRSLAPGFQAKIKLLRANKPVDLTVTLGKFEAKDLDFAFFTGKSAYLGVQLQELNEDLAPYFGVKAGEGALILDVEKDSPANKAGLKGGDVIQEVDGEAVGKPADVSRILAELKIGDKIEVKVIRQKKQETVKVELGERPGVQMFHLPEMKMLEKGEKKIVIAPEKINEKVKEAMKKFQKELPKKLQQLKETIYI